MIAFLIGGRFVGSFWAAVHFVAVGAVLYGNQTGLILKKNIRIFGDTESAFNIVLVAVVIYAIILLYEQMKNRMLESLEEAAHRNRLVLNNVGDGFLLVGTDGRLAPDCSAAVKAWFGPVTTGQFLWDYLCDDDNKRAMFRLTWDDLVADLMPRELLIEQLPSTLQRGAQTWRVQYRPVGANLEQVVVVVTDVTLELAAKAAEAERIEHAELLDRIVRDVESFRGFLKEAHALVDELQSNSASSARVLHTLKGNASLIGAQRLAKSCHELEDQIAAGAEVHAADFAALRTSLVALEHRFGVLLGEQAERLRVDIGDVDEVRGLVRGGAAVNAIEAVLDSWSGEPLRVVVDRLADQARALIRRLGRDGEVVVDADALRVPRGGLDAIMTVCSHVVRNAVDHGFESTDECLRFNKTAVPTLRCIAHRNEDAFVIAIADDGCGVDWERLANKARTQGLAHHTHNDLVTALFTDGVSTRDAVTELSGRGVGMAAVREAVERAGGRVDVESQRGRGTTVSLIFPASLLDRPAASRPEVEIHAAA